MTRTATALAIIALTFSTAASLSPAAAQQRPEARYSHVTRTVEPVTHPAYQPFAIIVGVGY